MTRVTKAWLLLLALSGASTILSVAVARGGLSGAMASLGGAAILTLAWAKARTILNAYLRLSEAPAFRRGFGLALGLYALLLLGLYLSA
ncbi:hypothetical protein [Defluviimonas sp. SAOS-178_SWC]|uniref:hypothetical protein n=1 Tax=Defluviimonas sp. SAOS-178_SWC TaxID=3121287 RepID=UPI003221840C